MTYELAEACESFCTTVVQGSDIIPTFCLASVVELRQEVRGGMGCAVRACEGL